MAHVRNWSCRFSDGFSLFIRRTTSTTWKGQNVTTSKPSSANFMEAESYFHSLSVHTLGWRTYIGYYWKRTHHFNFYYASVFFFIRPHSIRFLSAYHNNSGFDSISAKGSGLLRRDRKTGMQWTLIDSVLIISSWSHAMVSFFVYSRCVKHVAFRSGFNFCRPAVTCPTAADSWCFVNGGSEGLSEGNKTPLNASSSTSVSRQLNVSY